MRLVPFAALHSNILTGGAPYSPAVFCVCLEFVLLESSRNISLLFVQV